MNGHSASETLALRVLTWLASDERDLLAVFLGATGMNETDLKSRAADPDVLAAVLDFVLMDDAWVMSAGDTLGLRYEEIARARAMLPGGGDVHWT